MSECGDEWCAAVERAAAGCAWADVALPELLARGGCDAALAARCADFAVTAERDRALCQPHGTPLTRADAAALALLSVRTGTPAGAAPLAAADALLAAPAATSAAPAADAAPLLCRMLAALRAVEPVRVPPRLCLCLRPAERTALAQSGRVRLTRFVFARGTSASGDDDGDTLTAVAEVAAGPVLCYDLARFALTDTGDCDLVLEPGATLVAGTPRPRLVPAPRLVLARTTDAPGAVAVATAALLAAATEADAAEADAAEADAAEAVLRVLAASGACGAMHAAALRLLDAGTDAGAEAARRVLACAADTGAHAEAQYALAVLCMRGTARTPRDPARAAALFRAAAAGGIADAYNSLAQCILTGSRSADNGGAQDAAAAAEAVRCFERGAALGSALAANNLGLCLRAGLGGPRDAERACALFAQAAAAGLPDALVHHAECLLAGTGCAPDEARALALLRRAAAAGSAPAARLLDAIAARLRDEGP